MARHKGLSFYRRRKKVNMAIVREVFGWIFGVAAVTFVAFVAVFFLGIRTEVVGVSMEDTLYNGQTIYINRFLYLLSTPKRGDVVVFLPNGNENAHYYVKRVVGVPDDRIRIENGVLYVNGMQSEWVEEKILDAGIAANEFTLESGEYFCIGDNPNNSEDSRSANIGLVKEKDIIGRAWFCLSSGNAKMGLVK